MDSNNTLRAIDISTSTMVARGSLTTPDGGGSLFVGNGVAYISAKSLLTGGYDTVNVSDPNNLVLLSGASTNSLNAAPNPNVAANGSGLVLVAASGLGVSPTLELFNGANPANTGSFVTAIPLPGAALGLAVAGGIAYVADGGSGLQVANYLPFDTNGIPPTVSVDTTGLDVDVNTRGTQVVEGSTISLKASVADDVQVRSVELLLNGVVVQNAVYRSHTTSASMHPRSDPAPPPPQSSYVSPIPAATLR